MFGMKFFKTTVSNNSEKNDPQITCPASFDIEQEINNVDNIETSEKKIQQQQDDKLAASHRKL
jgi:hypothetical protein